MSFHSSSPKTHLQENNTYKLWENCMLDFLNSIQHVTIIVHKILSRYRNQRNTMKSIVFIIWWFTQVNLSRLQKMTTYKCGKTVSLNLIITSMLPQLILKYVFSLWKIKETLLKTQCSYILMNFHLTLAKTDCRKEYSISRLWETSLFHFHNTIHVNHK